MVAERLVKEGTVAMAAMIVNGVITVCYLMGLG